MGVAQHRARQHTCPGGPLAIRGFAMGVAVFALWTVNAAISFAFPIVNNALGSTGTFALFVAVNLVPLGFVSKFCSGNQGPLT